MVVSGFSSFSTKALTIAIPFVDAETCSEINFKKRGDVFPGMIVVVAGTNAVPIDAIIDPIFSGPSETEIKFPFSKFRT